MKKIILLSTSILLLLLLIGCNSSNSSNPNEDYCVTGQNKGVYLCEKRVISFFDTSISLKLYYNENSEYDVLEVFEYFEDTLSVYHQYFDKYNEYDGIKNVYTINHSTAPTEVSDELFEAIQFILDNDNIVTSNDKELFNIALGPVLNIWHDAREDELCDDSIETGILYCPVPSESIDDVEFNTSLNDITLDLTAKTISFTENNMSIDFGGFAKGYVSQIIANYLDSLDIEYLLNAGNSNIIAGGINPNNDDGKYYIALIRPYTDAHAIQEFYQFIAIPEGLAVVSSGNYQRFFKGLDDSLVYHHIIDPTTNYPGGYCMSISVLYPDSAIADILSTALYLLPVEEAKNFVNNYDQLEAVWYNYDGTIEYSDGFSPYIFELEE